MKLLKMIIVAVVFAFEGTMAFNTTMTALEAYQASGDVTYSLLAPIFFCGGALIAFGEFLRMMKGREWILLPMAGMQGCVFVLGLAAGMWADYAATGETDSMGMAMALSLLTLLLFSTGLGIWLRRRKKK